MLYGGTRLVGEKRLAGALRRPGPRDTRGDESVRSLRRLADPPRTVTRCSTRSTSRWAKSVRVRRSPCADGRTGAGEEARSPVSGWPDDGVDGHLRVLAVQLAAAKTWSRCVQRAVLYEEAHPTDRPGHAVAGRGTPYARATIKAQVWTTPFRRCRPASGGLPAPSTIRSSASRPASCSLRSRRAGYPQGGKRWSRLWRFRRLAGQVPGRRQRGCRRHPQGRYRRFGGDAAARAAGGFPGHVHDHLRADGAGRPEHHRRDVRVRVHLEREEAATRFRYELLLAPELEAHRPAIEERIARSPVRSTLSKPLTFEPA